MTPVKQMVQHAFQWPPKDCEVLERLAMALDGVYSRIHSRYSFERRTSY